MDTAKKRSIAIPVDLEDQITAMFQKQNLINKHTRVWLAKTATPKKLQTLHIPQPTLKHDDRTIIEGLQDIVSLLEDQLRPLVHAELSVLVDILYRPELLFPTGTEARRKCENGGFISKLITHTERLIEEKDEKLCMKILQTLKEMMAFDSNYEDRVSLIIIQFVLFFAYFHQFIFLLTLQFLFLMLSFLEYFSLEKW